ncbi:aspartate aminotransferase family protein [Segetibacter aerophilus]|uniref:Glutamate-1-semialdehyde 2,1-aminomutase n=1 Tax=Segetibacter aerophilus TaxID=670293 RepID=A0A512BJ88_9BACT|nr:aminotransferase class III-fold pyridoxal phosphate-dependent enzyme [Segetibacter aerophilus]GEO11887.1 glutamate-1-semialdehyde 2,1-aminomutase [Segetibacter aerophilus]
MTTNERQVTFQEISKEGYKYIAGGVVSLNRKVDPHIIFREGKGSKIYDVNGKEYIDYHAAFAPHFLGHNCEAVNNAVIEVINSQFSLIGSGTNELEISLAKQLCNLIPSLDLIQITNTGSEATAHAIRLSRAYTGKDHIILMLGGYNGSHNDVARIVLPSLKQIGQRKVRGEYLFLSSSAGIPEEVKQKIHCVNFNDLASVEYVLQKYPVACVLTEPVLQNIGVVLPKSGYLQGLVDLCESYGAVCIFDEVKTGFRSALSGYQSIANVTPHLSVFGKAIANGYPLGVIGGKREIMGLFDEEEPNKRVLIAGTYNAHPINTAAAIATLKILQNSEVYDYISRISNLWYSGLEALFVEKGIAAVVSRNASASCTYFSKEAPNDVHDILDNHDFDFDLKYRKALIEKGIYQIPIACKQNSVSYAHSEDDIYKTLDLTRQYLRSL